MGEQAVALAKAVDYRSAGTVEFIVDAERNFYFLEMNTRLQVEHPVTEMITGIDLVEQMIRIAAGEKLEITQNDVVLDGWAIESRLYAEDPVRGFLPSTGRLVRYLSASGENVRVDTGVGEGDEISLFYDPMIAKLCTWGETRAEAVAEMSAALDRTVIRGIGNNVGFLSAVMDHPRFQEGRLSTNFIADEYPDGFTSAVIDTAAAARLVAVTAAVHCLYVAREGQLPGQLSEQPTTVPGAWVVGVDETDYSVHVSAEVDAVIVEMDDHRLAVRSDWAFGQILFEGSIDGEDIALEIERLSGGYRIAWRGIDTTVTVRSARAAELAGRMPKKEPPDLSRYLLSPMPGLVVSINVSEGETVQPGQTLAVIDAMKMENVLTAERQGVVAAIKAEAGDNLATDQVILEFE